LTGIMSGDGHKSTVTVLVSVCPKLTGWMTMVLDMTPVGSETQLPMVW